MNWDEILDHAKTKKKRNKPKNKKKKMKKPWTRKEKEEFWRRHAEIQNSFPASPTATNPWPEEMKAEYTRRIWALHTEFNAQVQGNVTEGRTKLNTTNTTTTTMTKEIKTIYLSWNAHLLIKAGGYPR